LWQIWEGAGGGGCDGGDAGVWWWGVWLMLCVFGFSWYLILWPFSNMLRFAWLFFSRWWFSNMLRFAGFFVSNWPPLRRCWLFEGELRRIYLGSHSTVAPSTFDSMGLEVNLY
jgi:hypothetical protein